MTIFIIARLTFREAARRKILLAALLLGLVYLLIYGVGFYYVNQEANRSEFGPGLLELNQIRNFLFMAGLYVVNFLTVMMAVLTSVDTVSGEIASVWFPSLFSAGRSCLANGWASSVC
jgi:ABC-type transport system involved in multi-copper enzyme maturation permease subunit